MPQTHLFSRPAPPPAIEQAIQAAGLPSYEKEVQFHPVRKWRFDIAFISWKVAVEIEGAVWSRGRHNTGDGMTKDIEKYNEAQILGWLVIRVTTKQVAAGEAVDPIVRALESRGWRRNV